MSLVPRRIGGLRHRYALEKLAQILQLRQRLLPCVLHLTFGVASNHTDDNIVVSHELTITASGQDGRLTPRSSGDIFRIRYELAKSLRDEAIVHTAAELYRNPAFHQSRFTVQPTLKIYTLPIGNSNHND